MRPQVGRGKGTAEASTFVHILAVPYFDSIYSPNFMSPLGVPIQCLVDCVCAQNCGDISRTFCPVD